MPRDKPMEITLHFHLFEITLHRNKEYDEHSLIATVTSQNMNSVFPLHEVPDPYFLERGREKI